MSDSIMARPSLLELAEIIEAQGGPNRDLDAAVAPLQGLRVVNEGHPLGRCCYDSAGRLAVLLSYTRSVDAAMMLIPSGWQLEMEQHTNGWTATLANAPWFGDNRRVADAYSVTPALALTAAAIRARAAQEVHHDQ